MPAAEAIALRPGRADFSLVRDGDLVAVAVSGGSDSIGLLHFTFEAFGPQRVVALTVDHGLRAASADEARSVAQWCRALGVRHTILHWHGEKPSQGVQAKARQARYDLMSAWCKANGIGVLMTGHTANDQAETVAMRARRTESFRSRAGIWPETTWQGVRVLRPMLSLHRDEVRAWLSSRGVPWLEDPSNVNTRFERVRVRQKLPAADIAGLALQAQSAQEQVRDMDEAAHRWLIDHAAISDFAHVSLPRAAFVRLDADVADAVLRWCLVAAGVGIAPPPGGIARLRQHLAAEAYHRQTLAGALVARRAGRIIIGREPGRVAGPVVIPAAGLVVWDGRFVVTGPAGTVVRAAGDGVRRPETGLPAFLVAGLPVAQMGDGPVIFPHFDRECGVGVQSAWRLRL